MLSQFVSIQGGARQRNVLVLWSLSGLFLLLTPSAAAEGNRHLGFNSAQRSNYSEAVSEIARKTGQRWISGQLYALATGKFRASDFSPNSRAHQFFLAHKKGKLVAASIRDLFWDKIRSIGVGQGASLFNAKFPAPNPAPAGLEAHTLRETSSLILTVRVQFVDGSSVNLVLPKVPAEKIEEIYQFAETRLSPINGFWTSRLQKADKLFAVIGSYPLIPKSTREFNGNQIGSAEF